MKTSKITNTVQSMVNQLQCVWDKLNDVDFGPSGDGDKKTISFTEIEIDTFREIIRKVGKC